jgi:23S rRNA (adenine2503-C2)-methyltransferase
MVSPSPAHGFDGLTISGDEWTSLKRESRGQVRLSNRISGTTSMAESVNILDLTPERLREFLRTLGGNASQADAIAKSVYREGVAGFSDMIELDPALRQRLAAVARLGALEPLDEKVSANGDTRKFLFRLEDGQTIESALMSSRDARSGRERRTICVSSQVGCSVGCPFCATGQQGFERNLSSGEIIEQVLFFIRRFGRITNVVFMGMGEPLANYLNVRQSIAVLNWPKGIGLGTHQVTLSTAGLVPQIRQIAGEGLSFQLAVSLHTASDSLRNHLVPVNRKYPLEMLIGACKEYNEKTGRSIFFEYALFKGVNDTLSDATELVRLLADLKCSVNLILGNPAPSSDFQPSSRQDALAFQKKVIAGGFRAMLRVSRGADIEAGCGQLRSRWTNNSSQART